MRDERTVVEVAVVPVVEVVVTVVAVVLIAMVVTVPSAPQAKKIFWPSRGTLPDSPPDNFPPPIISPPTKFRGRRGGEIFGCVG